MKPPAPLRMWAVLIVGRRAQWIDRATLHRTRAGAWREFLSYYGGACQADLWRRRRRGWYKLVRVTVQVDPPQEGA